MGPPLGASPTESLPPCAAGRCRLCHGLEGGTTDDPSCSPDHRGGTV